MGRKKEVKKFEKLLGKFIKNKEVVKIEREFNHGSSNIYGVISDQSDLFLDIIEIDEFNFDGQVIIRKDDFDFISSNDYDKFYKKILTKEGLFKKNLKSKSNVDLSSWASIFSDLKEKDIHVVVDCEALKNPSFIIGPIVEVAKNSVYIRYYDAEGRLDQQASKVKFRDITSLRFNDRYSTVLRKYLKPTK